MIYARTSTTIVEIDPNVRARGNQTYSKFAHVSGPLAVGDSVRVVEPESGLEGTGRIAAIYPEREIVFLEVDWRRLRVPPMQLTVDALTASADIQSESLRSWVTAYAHGDSSRPRKFHASTPDARPRGDVTSSRGRVSKVFVPAKKRPREALTNW